MNYILQESLQIGQKIPNEFELAEKFGVRRSTIREAVKSLVSKGILEIKRGSGTYVISTNSLNDDPLGLSKFDNKYKLALELFEVRLMLEPEIASLTAKYVSQEEAQQIKKLCDETHHAFTNAILDKDSIGAKCAMIMHLTYNCQALIKQSKESFKEKIEN